MSNSDRTNQPAGNGKTKRTKNDKQWRAKRRKIDAALEPVNWGGYDPDFTIPDGAEGPKEMHRFINGLEGLAHFAKTKTCLINALQEAAPPRSTLGQLDYLLTLPALPQEDITLVRSHADLHEHLDKVFRLPLLHRATDATPTVVPQQYNLADFLKDMSSDEDTDISVYDYSIGDAQGRTYTTKVRKLRSSFPSCPDAPALNFLDIENRTGLQFCPSAVRRQDLVFRIGAQQGNNKGKTASSWAAPNSPEFFLASMKNSLSSIHIDSGGGNTWIAILDGRKIWYFPRFADEQSVLQLAAAGSLATENYQHGWVKVELRAGDVLVMPPGLPHAVFTPEDCLAVGAQFYTAPHLGKSLRTLALQERYPDISNEDLSGSSYAALASFLEMESSHGFLNPIDKMSVVSNALTLDRSPRTMVEAAKNQLTDLRVQFNKKAKLPELLELLKLHLGGVHSTVQRQRFVTSLDAVVSAVREAS